MATMVAFLVKVRDRLLGAAGGPLARGAWCRTQRRALRVPGQAVVWVRREAVPWAEWGAERGYFELQHMSGLPYLRLLGSPVA